MKNLTKNQLIDACKKHDYLAVRLFNATFGLNCKVIKTRQGKRVMESKDFELDSYGFYPISFMEYISIKLPFKN